MPLVPALVAARARSRLVSEICATTTQDMSFASPAPPGTAAPQSPAGAGRLRAYVKQHAVEPLLAEALKAACDANAEDPVLFIGKFMMAKAGKAPVEEESSAAAEAADYLKRSAVGVASQVRTNRHESCAKRQHTRTPVSY